MSKRTFLNLLLIVFVIFSLLIPLHGAFAQGHSAEAFERVRQVQEKHTGSFMAKPGVVGTAIGLGQGAQPVMLILLEYGGVPGIPEHLDGVQVRPLVTGKIYALPKPDNSPGKDKDPPPDEVPVDPTAYFERPVPIGVSTGHPDISAGTIGCRVTDGIDVYALSNNHVYANSNQAYLGDPVYQPGTYDGDGEYLNRDDEIGTLAEFVPINFDGQANYVDAAIALSSTSDLGRATPSDGYGMPKSTIFPYKSDLLNKPVMKYGRTTGLTKGKVYAVKATVNVNYGVSGTALFENQIVITPGSFSLGGDSGSLVVLEGKKRNMEDDRKPVGLLFAGSDLYAIANPIKAVLNKLELEFEVSIEISIDGEK